MRRNSEDGEHDEEEGEESIGAMLTEYVRMLLTGRGAVRSPESKQPQQQQQVLVEVSSTD